MVTAVNGEPVDDSGALRLRISRTAPGSDVKLTVQREGGQRELTVTLGKLPERGGPAGRGGEEGPQRWRGEFSERRLRYRSDAGRRERNCSCRAVPGASWSAASNLARRPARRVCVAAM